MSLSWKNALPALPVLLLLAGYAGTAFGLAGNVQFVIGDVKLITRTGETRTLQKGAAVDEGDRIVTADGASAQIKMIDGGFIAVRPNTNIGFDTYRYAGKEDGTENAAISLLRGGFRTITGIIGRSNKQNYLVKTATATIGIRGTDHEPMVILVPAPGQVAIAPPGTYDKVNVGIAFIRNDAGSIDIHRNQVGFAPVTRAAPVILPRIPPFYKPTPAPGPQKAKEEAKDEGKKETQQTAAAAPAQAAEEAKPAAPAEKAAEAPAQIRDTAVVDPTTSVATAPAAATTATAPAAAAPVVAVTATDASGTTVNTTTQTLTSSTGTTTPLSQGAFAVEAQAAADAAAASAAALSTLLTAASPSATTTTAASAVSAAQPAVTSASTAATSIAALSIDTALAASNATAAAALATAAAAQVSTATTNFNANGSFADATIAVPAFAALNAANAALQTASGSAQTAAGTATAQSSTLTSAQSAASAALAAANQALTAANSTLAALTAAGVPSSSSASTLLSAAQTAATAAQSAATQAQTLQSAGDFTGAQAQLAIAQQQAQAAADALASAPQMIAAVVSADAAQLAAASLTAASTGLLSVATSAQSAGASAVSTTSTQLAAAQTEAPSVQQNAVLAAYNNPAVASGNFIGALSGVKSVTGGVEQVADGPSMLSANTNYVLDGNKSLVEIRNVAYDRSGFNYSAATINNADITFSGGTAKDQANDPNGVYYFGRWQGGLINVKDLAATGAIAPFSDALGSASAHWIVGLVPGNSTLPSTAGGPINNTQQIVGTANYSLAAATHPTDALGNVGTLNSATLAANFSTQTVDAALGLTFSSTDLVNVSTRNLSISASASNVPIQGTGFEVKSGMANAPVINCTSASGDCAAGYVGGFGGAFLSTASAGSTTGAVGTGAALMYRFTPSIASAPASQPFADLIQGLGVLSSSAAPTVGATNFSSTAVLRSDVLWSTTQVAPGANPATTTYLVSDKSRENLFNNSSGTPATPLTTPLTTPVTLTAPTNNTNFLFDASGNLVRVFDTPHVVFDLGNDVPGSSTQFAAPTPLANAQLSFGGGAASSESYYDPGTSIRLGRWTGGVVNVTDLTTGEGYVEPLVAPGGAARSVQWVVAQTPSSLPLTGEFHYTRINDAAGIPSFATAPTDSYGNVGTLEGARLSADFTNMKASAGVRISMPSGPAGSLGVQNLSARFDNAPISGGGFNVSSSSGSNPAGTDNLHVGCFGPGCAPDITLPTGSVVSAYGGRFRGAFTSATGNAGTADGAFLRYTFDTLYGVYAATPPAGRVVDDYVNGLVAFKQGPEILHPTSAVYPTAAPTGPVVLVANYGYNSATGNVFTGGQTYWVDTPSAANPATSTPYLVTDAAGNLLSLAEGNSAMHGDDRALVLSGGTANPATPTTLAIGSSATATDGTILLGWQQPTGATALTLSGMDYNGCFGTGCTANPTPRTVLADGLSWVRGPAPFPDYLPGAIAGYSNSSGVVVPGTATYDLGASSVRDQSGAVGSVTSAGLTVNFNSASVAFNMAATTADGNWTASAAGVRMNQDGTFYASPPGARTISSGTTVAPTTMHDNLSVAFSGGGSTWGNIRGQLMGIGLGGAGVTYNLNSFLPCPSPCTSVTASGALAFGLNSAQQPYSTLTPYQLIAFATGMNAAGQIDSEENHRIQGGFVSPNRTQTVNGFPVKVDGDLSVAVTYDAPCTINCGPFVNDIPVVYAVAGAIGPASIGTATLLESGYDVSSGLRWGRYGGGTIGVNDRIGGASLGTLDASTQNVHFIMTGTQSGPTVLPLTGTFNYTFVGGTAPTDSNGNVGTPLTAANASLTANFSTQKVDAALSNLVVGGNTWGASATGMPITGNVFQADKKPNGEGNLTVTSTLGSNTSGSLAGVFTGATGSGVGMLYSLNHGGNSVTNPAAVTVSGVAAFRR